MMDTCSWELPGRDLAQGVSLYDGESNLPRILAGLLATCRVLPLTCQGSAAEGRG